MYLFLLSLSASAISLLTMHTYPLVAFAVLRLLFPSSSTIICSPSLFFPFFCLIPIFSFCWFLLSPAVFPPLFSFFFPPFVRVSDVRSFFISAVPAALSLPFPCFLPEYSRFCLFRVGSSAEAFARQADYFWQPKHQANQRAKTKTGGETAARRAEKPNEKRLQTGEDPKDMTEQAGKQSKEKAKEMKASDTFTLRLRFLSPFPASAYMLCHASARVAVLLPSFFLPHIVHPFPLLVCFLAAVLSSRGA